MFCCLYEGSLFPDTSLKMSSTRFPTRNWSKTSYHAQTFIYEKNGLETLYWNDRGVCLGIIQMTNMCYTEKPPMH